MTGATASRLRAAPPISNRSLGMMLLIGSETVLFSCLISAYVVLRSAVTSWPPAGTPRLTLGLSVINTAILMASAFYAYGASRAMRRERLSRTRASLVVTILLGGLFLLLQAVEFRTLYARGLTLAAGTYSAIFFTLAGCHGLHVMGGLGYLAVVWNRTGNPPSPEALREAVSAASLYWYFVTAVWLILFCILYIA
jgi:cytochrome c oxidase subunit III